MKLLAIETSSLACSVALQVGEDIQQQHVVEAKAHTRILLPMIKTLLGDAGMNVSELDALVLGNGPGSFIGMRIGASVVQGLAFAAGLNVIPVSSLAAVAAEVFLNHGETHVAVTQDARMNQVYLGCFVRSEAGLPVPVEVERIHDIGQIALLSDDRDVAWLGAGEGWRKYPSLASMQSVELTGLPDILLPRAVHLLGIARDLFESGQSIPPEQLQPAYLRDEVAVPPKRL
jgi:tRNA threonylcarbamoyladenosine biosynthesis protein TsaB